MVDRCSFKLSTTLPSMSDAFDSGSLVLVSKRQRLLWRYHYLITLSIFDVIGAGVAMITASYSLSWRESSLVWTLKRYGNAFWCGSLSLLFFGETCSDMTAVFKKKRHLSLLSSLCSFSLIHGRSIPPFTYEQQFSCQQSISAPF